MFPDDHPLEPVKERRSRRSHKNSKDGCPNCRANRVKCSEDLPSCLQCIKKNYRCGYMDFPPKKLEHIRRKNEMLRPHVPANTSSLGNVPLGSPVAPDPEISPMFQPCVPTQPTVMMQHFEHPVSSSPLHVHAPPARMAFGPRPEPSFAQPYVPHMSPLPHDVIAQPGQMFAPAFTADHRFVNSSGFAEHVSQGPPVAFLHLDAFHSNTAAPSSQHLHGTTQLDHGIQPALGPTRVHMHIPSSHASNDEYSQLQGGRGALPFQPPVHISYLNQHNAQAHTGAMAGSYSGSLRDARGGSPNSSVSDDGAKLHDPQKHHLAAPSKRKKIRIRELASRDRKLSETVSPNVRSMMYSNAFLEITHDLGPIEKHMPPHLEPEEVGQLLAIESIDKRLSLSTKSVPRTSAFYREEKEPDSDRIESLFGKFLNKIKNQSGTANQSTHIARIPSPDDKFLPNCEFKLTNFRKLDVPQRLQSNLLEQTVRDLKQDGAHIRYNTTVKANYMRPVYHERDFRMLWLEVLLRATVYEFFFIYFIDKSINILMRASEKIVNGDVVFSPLLDSSSSSLPDADAISKPVHFFYNRDDLNLLTAKSYVTFGRVIAELRNSISLYSPEFPARMSMFSAWACFTNPQSDMKTFRLMARGTLTLFKNSLNECITKNTPVYTMHKELLLIENFLRQSLYQDYNFTVVRNMEAGFQNFKSYVDNLVNLHENGAYLDDELISVIYDPVFRHDFHELNKIFDRLINHYFIQIDEQNRYYKALHNHPDDANIHFVSPSLLFDMAYEWFYLYADEEMYMSSKINPLKRIMFMFYHALAKSLSHVVTPLKSILVADACNITCTKVGTIFTKPDLLDHDHYLSLKPILSSLMKTVRFFDIRLQLLAYHAFQISVIDDQFIRGVPQVANKFWKYNDIIEILPAKLKVCESQIENFSQTSLAAHNYPFPDELYDNPITAEMIRAETERHQMATQNEPFEFDFISGFSNHDFNPSKIVNFYCDQKKDLLDCLPPIPLHQLSNRLDNLLGGMDTVSCSSKNLPEPHRS